MDEYTADLFISRDDASDHQPHSQPPPTVVVDEWPHDSDISEGTPSKKSPSGLRSRIANNLSKKTSIQDRLVERLLQQVIPESSDGLTSGGDDPLAPGFSPDKTSTFSERPNFNITTMSNNFRRFNARIGVVFKFQARVVRLLSWRRPTHTLSLLAVYTFVCLDPYLLTVVPLAGFLLAVFIPSFLARHPAPPSGTLSSEQSVGYSPKGPPLAPARTVKPVKELSKDFFRNMRDLQNSMDDFCVAHDGVVATVLPITNFSNEALSSALFLALTLTTVLMTTFASLLPWRLIALLAGWAAILSGHPAIAPLLTHTHDTHVAPHEAQARSSVDAWIAGDIILDSAPETREVEIFELQRASHDEWEPWLFSPSPYDPLSQPRIAGDRPRGTRFFEDVLPPDGWVWSEKKWALDLWSREWVEERIITGVEVETEGERWVYDMFDENSAAGGGFGGPVDSSPTTMGKGKARVPSAPLSGWEEGEDGTGKRGEWRRRRWVRLVKRRATMSTA
ncbi:integral peroxisomal membrane peroxin [Colletotrichum scovillei]|uniref:Integral peroxisomal membrane peroxin n=1 Tax=Colletotrichum scovillei TaxID=1209932 RepID=A0A9P7RDN9_9PEZI|nr:integral peroxisomal membrane peroxin [Colletotrichum scovillei]KAF4785441.1 integral peroxisomal membrane peroxin [Colletotrichum scovillei]KAG7055416.1 integral peroxisomal membrane peroxin [Colletotrichum scovillei]KAG7074805.1 integral peroxisomal membrane peroxin [Colletotrichum scovillei]KAG7081896.1 integral peroxisomal membrane peroxin [Colletotrichum scovillei]